MSLVNVSHAVRSCSPLRLMPFPATTSRLPSRSRVGEAGVATGLKLSDVKGRCSGNHHVHERLGSRA